MAFGRVYAVDCLGAMKNMVRNAEHPRARVELFGRRYPGTKVMPFTTFGVTAAIHVGDQVFMGTGVAPMATSGGVREPQAVGDLNQAQSHLKMLQERLNAPCVNVLSPIAVDELVLGLDKLLAEQRALVNPRPTSGIGSEVATAVTVALMDAQAAYFGLPTALAMRAVYLHLQGKEPDVDGLVAPLPKFNILNFGVHSGTKRPDNLPYIWLQETKVAPIGAANFEEAVFMGIEILKQIIKVAKTDNIGFEAGISPALTSPEQVYEMAAEAIEKAGLSGKVVLAADAAASEFSDPISEGSSEFLYRLYPDKQPLTAAEMVGFWKEMVNKYPILSIEDGMNSEDTAGWLLLMAELGKRIEIQGDDLFVTDAEEAARLRNCANSVLVKPNQAGSIVRTLRLIAQVRAMNYTISPSHRSGKVPGGYGIIPELTLATQAEWIKPGSPRRERQGFVNNVMTLADELALLGIPVGYAGPVVAQRFGFPG